MLIYRLHLIRLLGANFLWFSNFLKKHVIILNLFGSVKQVSSLELVIALVIIDPIS